MMKRPILSSWIRIALFLMISTCVVAVTITIGARSTAHASPTITVTQCHTPPYSTLVSSQSGTDSAGDDVIVQLWYCSAYQSVYGRVFYINGQTAVAQGSCEVDMQNSNPGEGRSGCTNGVPIGSSVDTQLTYGPAENWSACWFHLANTTAASYICTSSVQPTTGGETSN